MKTHIIVGIILFALCTLGHAQVSVRNYEKLKGTENLEQYIDGLGTGFTVSNVWMYNNFSRRMYCPPNKLAIETANYIRILDDVIKDGRQRGIPRIDDDSIELLLLMGLQRTFPCGVNHADK